METSILVILVLLGIFVFYKFKPNKQKALEEFREGVEIMYSRLVANVESANDDLLSKEKEEEHLDTGSSLENRKDIVQSNNQYLEKISKVRESYIGATERLSHAPIEERYKLSKDWFTYLTLLEDEHRVSSGDEYHDDTNTNFMTLIKTRRGLRKEMEIRKEEIAKRIKSY